MGGKQETLIDCFSSYTLQVVHTAPQCTAMQYSPPTPDFPLNLFSLSAIIAEEGEVHASIQIDEIFFNATNTRMISDSMLDLNFFY